MNTIIETGSIVGLASQGQGIMRQEGFVTFIPFTARGDKLQYQTTQRKKKFAVGKLITLLEPSAERVTPKCPYYTTCGGCQLQHINYEAQVAYKRDWIEQALRKIGQFQDIDIPPVMPANQQWGYRRRINLILRPYEESFQVGYIALDNKSLVSIESCSIFVENDDPIIKAVQEIGKQLMCKNCLEGKVTILKDNLGYILHFYFRKMPKNLFQIISTCMATYPFINGILATSPQKTFQLGTIQTSCQIDQLSFDFTPKTFIQNHPEQSLNIYKTIENLAKKQQPKSVLDLYCGIGISSLLLGQQDCRVKGVELNPQAIELAKANAKKNHLGHVQFVIADVEKVLDQLLENDKPDFIIVNPPREGLSTATSKALQSKPAKTLIYVSCLPATLARDLKILCEKGYQLSSIQAFDMFPQTLHVETIAVLSSWKKKS